MIEIEPLAAFLDAIRKIVFPLISSTTPQLYPNRLG